MQPRKKGTTFRRTANEISLGLSKEECQERRLVEEGKNRAPDAEQALLQEQQALVLEQQEIAAEVFGDTTVVENDGAAAVTATLQHEASTSESTIPHPDV